MNTWYFLCAFLLISLDAFVLIVHIEFIESIQCQNLYIGDSAFKHCYLATVALHSPLFFVTYRRRDALSGADTTAS